MTQRITGLLYLVLSTGLLAQGTVNFNNSPGALGGTGAPVFWGDGVTRLAGTAWLAQLYAGPEVGSLQPWGAPLTFRTGAGAGFFDTTGVNTSRVIGTVAAGAVATIEVRVWQAAAGSSYEQAQAVGASHGRSAPFIVPTGGGGSPPALPANLVGLTPFSVPEPSTFVLLVVGAACAWRFSARPGGRFGV